MTQEQTKEAADRSWGQDKSTPLYKVGDVVEYLPHACHSFNCDGNNVYPWVIGVKQNPHYEENPETGEKVVVEDVVEIDEGKLHRSILPGIAQAPNSREERARLVPLRPRKPWRAVVTRANPDGTVDLDVESNVGSGMVTLGYPGVPIDETGRTPHTCRRAKGGA